MNAPLHDCALDRGYIKQETKEPFKDRLWIHFEILIAHEVCGNFCCNLVEHLCVVLLHVLGERVNPFVPVLWEVFLVVLCVLETMTVQVEEVEKAGVDINRISCNDNHRMRNSITCVVCVRCVVASYSYSIR